MLAHNPLREEGSAHLYILHTANPRVLISVRPLELGNQVGEEPDDLKPGKVFRSKSIRDDFGTTVVSIEMDLQSGIKSKNIELTPKLEIVLYRAWHWFVAFKLQQLRPRNDQDLPRWMLA
jgi:hypothetical protein